MEGRRVETDRGWRRCKQLA